MLQITFARRLAYVFGIAAPVIETWRRWHELRDWTIWPAWFDDIILGGLLLLGAQKSRDPRKIRYLTAAWGFASGMIYYSFFGQLAALNRADPSGFPSAVVATVKGVAFALAILAFVLSLRGAEENAP
jgi:hypothetical protein